MEKKEIPRIVNAMPLRMPSKDLKPYNILENEEDNTAEIVMYGEVVQTIPTDWWTGEKVDGLYIELAEFMADIDDLKTKDKITVRINSVGGDLQAGVAIYNRLKEMKNVTTIVDGLAASAASLILQAGSKRLVYNASQVMAHEASVGLCGYYNLTELKGVGAMLEAANNQVIAIYEEKTGQSRAKLKHLVEKTTWMTGQEIIDNGFADEIITGEVTMSMSSDRSLFLCNGIPLNVKQMVSLPNNVVVSEPGTTPGTNKNNPKKEEKNIMNMEELKAKHPDLVKQIEDEARETVDTASIRNEAVEGERKRIQEIESIEASIADKELVNEAKYGEKTMDAKELAFQAMQKQAKLGNNFLDAMSNDAGTSGAADVTSAPAMTQEEKDAKDMEAAINAAKAMRGGK